VLLFQVCFTFNPVQEGCYQLPLFLRVKDGKQLQLQLSGRAVSPCAQLPLLVLGGQSCVLAAAPLGDLEPPLQCYTLRNGGPAPLRYRCANALLDTIICAISKYVPKASHCQRMPGMYLADRCCFSGCNISACHLSLCAAVVWTSARCSSWHAKTMAQRSSSMQAAAPCQVRTCNLQQVQRCTATSTW
jgi:hypothetical protein